MFYILQVITGQISLLHNSGLTSSAFQRFGFSSSASPESNEKGTENGATATANPDEAKENESSDDKELGLLLIVHVNV